MAIETNFQEAILDLVTDLVSGDKVNINEAIFQSVFEVSPVTANHTVMTGVRNGNVIPILNTEATYTSFPYKDPSTCTTPSCDLNLSFASKVWSLGMIECKTPICINTFDENFLIFWNTHKRVFGDENLESALIRYITDQFKKELEAAMWRVIWFGDTSTPDSDPYYSLLRSSDGVFTQAEAMGGTKIVIDENAAGTGLTGPELYAYLQEAYNVASLEAWWDPATVRFEMTQKMAAVLVAWLNSITDKSAYQCECFSPDGLTAQRTFSIQNNISIFGIPVHIHREFDGVINALNLGNPYRAILTTNSNIVIGTTVQDQLPAFDIWYSKDDGLIYIKGGTQVGGALLTNQYVYLGSETEAPSI